MNMIEKRKAQAGQGGFTLIELLVVIAILAVLGGAVIIGIGALRGNAEEQVCETNEETVNLAIEAYDVAEGAPPANIGVLTTPNSDGDAYITEGIGDWVIGANGRASSAECGIN